MLDELVHLPPEGLEGQVDDGIRPRADEVIAEHGGPAPRRRGNKALQGAGERAEHGDQGIERGGGSRDVVRHLGSRRRRAISGRASRRRSGAAVGSSRKKANIGAL